jgi:hypothetical protein
MKSSDLNSFFLGNIDVMDIKNSIQQDVENYSRLMKREGSTIPLNFIDNESVHMNQANLKKLLQETINGKLSNIHLAYICDCLSIAEDFDFENEKILNVINEIADPEINGGYKSIDELNELLKKL